MDDDPDFITRKGILLNKLIISLVHFKAEEEDLVKRGAKQRYKSTGRPKGILKLRRIESSEVNGADESLPLSFKPSTYIFKSMIKNINEEKENEIKIFLTDVLEEESPQYNSSFESN